MKTSFIYILIMLLGTTLFAQQQTGIHWKTWSELEQALDSDPKPVFVYFHADWCTYCKKMEREVFTKQPVIDKINADYYAVHMDVESTDPITFDGVTFINEQAKTHRNGIHQLPLLLASPTHESLTLPATLIFDRDFALKTKVFTYYTSKQLLKTL